MRTYRFLDAIDFSSDIAMPLDSNASVDAGGVTAEYAVCDLCNSGEASSAEGSTQRHQKTKARIGTVLKLCDLCGDRSLGF